MPFTVPIDQAKKEYPEYEFLSALTPSEQKAAFHVCKNGEHLCLKIISPSYDLDRLHREIEALQNLSHPNVVRLREYTFSSKSGQQKHYMVEEFIEGSDLDDLLVPGAPWQRKEVAKVFIQLCEGLFALKKKGIVHRDLKPRNIRVRKDGTPVIIDFGLARHLAMPDLTKTTDGAAIGTPAYFAPEQADSSSNKRNIDHRTDLFAVGVILYQALVGTHPFYKPGMTCDKLMSAICNSTEFRNDPTFISLPNEWRLLSGRLLEKLRVNRPNSAEQVAKMLSKLGGI